MTKSSFNVSIKKEGLNCLNNIIKNISKRMSSIDGLNLYLKEKVVQTYREIMEEKLTGGTTNDKYITLYKNSYHTKDIQNGFILYNNANIDIDDTETSRPYQYPNGFSIAMAFEYGVGIVGMRTGNPNAWKYNLHKYPNGWYYLDDMGEAHFTAGYKGFEIFRELQNRITANNNQLLKKWSKEYYESGGN